MVYIQAGGPYNIVMSMSKGPKIGKKEQVKDSQIGNQRGYITGPRTQISN